MPTIKDLGNGRAIVSWYDSNGRQHRQILPKKQAQELYDQVCAQRVLEGSGIDPAFSRKAKNNREMTFAELATPYREYLLKTRAKNNACYVDKINNKWGKWRIDQITISQARPWVIGLIQQPEQSRYAISTIKKLIAYFKRIFNYGVEIEIISQNPILRLENDRIRKELRRVQKRTKIISTEQFWDLTKDFPLWLKRPCICAWSSGMRQDEVLSLKWKSVNLSERLIQLQSSDTKEADNKTIGIDPDLYEVLLEIQKERGTYAREENVFLSIKGLQIGRNFFGSQFRKYADKAGYEDLRFHDFRHCFTVRKRREGFDKSVIKAQTGHHTDHMFTWYDKVDQTEIQQMAGFTQVNCDELKSDVERLIKSAKEQKVPLGAIQFMVGKAWRTIS